ncbi:MAG: serine protease [Planctomycetaceae bacterium]|nr:serine protease [Planctomycetaceae bacterium]
MSDEMDSVFVSVGEYRDPQPVKKRGAWLLVLAGLLVLLAIGIGIFSPVLRQAMHLAELRGKGVMIGSHVELGVWSEFVSWVYDYTGWSLPNRENVIEIWARDVELSEDLWDSLKQYPEVRQLAVSSENFNRTQLEELCGAWPDLKMVQIVNCPKISPEMIEELRVANPGIKYDYRGTSLLGITVDIGRGASRDCLVDHVQLGSAAFHGGILTGDTIQMINDVPVAEFEELVMLLAEYHPGDQVRVQVMRADGTNQELTCTLDAWQRAER